MKSPLNASNVLYLLIGMGMALATTPETLQQALQSNNTLIAVALVATLLVPFAGFSVEERWQKFVLLNTPYILLGVYMVAAYYDSSQSVVLVLASISMHVSYWVAGIHSRAYRLDQLKLSGLGSAEELQQIAKLNVAGRSIEADLIVQRILAIKE